MSTSASPAPKAVFFLGATGGCGLSALRRSLAAGHICIALCRAPERLTAVLTDEEQRLIRIEKGNAHDAAVVQRCLVHPNKPNAFVDAVISSIGNQVSWQGIKNADPDVCKKGMEVLLEGIRALRTDRGLTGRPRIVGFSSTGISSFGRDLPVIMVPLYKILLAGAHRDKKAMEDAMIASGEDWTVVRASALTSGKESTKNTVRAGMENPLEKKIESKAIGYTISREDAGKWIFENIIQEIDSTWVQRIATITY